MQSSFIRRTLPQLIFVIAAVTVGVFLSARDSENTQAIGTFGSSSALTGAYCNQIPGPGFPSPLDPLCSDGAGALALDATLDLTTRLAIGGSDYNFSFITTTTPGAGFVAPGPGSATDSGTTTAGTTATVLTDSVGGFTAGALVGNVLRYTSGPASGQARTITANTATTITTAAFAPAPAASGDAYSVGFIAGTDPALGDLLGALVSNTNLGLTNNSCSAVLTVEFKFMSSTVDNSAGNQFYPLQVAQASNNGTLENMQTDEGRANGPDDVIGGGDDIAGALPVNGLPAAVERYPSYLNDVFDPDWINNGPDGIELGAPGDTDGEVNGAIPPVQPIQRLRGGAIVSNSSVELDLLIFAPGVIAAAFPAPHPFNDLTADMGYTTVTVLQNPTASAAPSAITDFCASLTTLTTVYGESRLSPCNGTILKIGTTTAGTTATVLTDSAGGFTPGALVGSVLQYKTGPAALGLSEGQTRTILANTATTITTPSNVGGPPPEEFTPAPADSGDSYTVVPAGCAGIGGISTPPTGANSLRDRARTPTTAGTYLNVGVASSLRDSDGDGIENSLDTCSQTVNLDASPRTASGADFDMIDSVCDPNSDPIMGNEPNRDGDFAANLADWQNAGDNCPVLGNGNQKENELNHSYYELFATNPAPQGGPKTDAIGDACDFDGSEFDQCGNGNNDDTDALANDGCPLVGAFSEAGAPGPCANTSNEFDEDPGASTILEDLAVNDGCPAVAAAESDCADSEALPLDDDADTVVNDGCPTVGAFSEAGAPGPCANINDEPDEDPGAAVADDDGLANDGCPASGPAESVQCANATDDNVVADGFINDGCPAAGPATSEAGAQCANGTDDDADYFVNDGCPTAGTTAEGGAVNCLQENTVNDDPGDDALINDGCPARATPEVQATQCANAVDEDLDGAINDGCEDIGRANGDFLSILNIQAKCFGGVDADDDGYCVGAPTAAAILAGAVATNDTNDTAGPGAAVVPEDYDLTFATGVAHSGSGDNPPERQPVQVCNDGIDNDGDTLIDNLDSTPAANSSCHPTGVTSHPGFPACPALGCALDADGDGFTNERERLIGTNALGRCGVGLVPAQSGDWPIDLVSASGSDDRITLTDITNFLAPTRRLNTFPGHVNFSARWDLVPGSGGAEWIIIDDLTALIAGASGNPPMNGGVRAYGSPPTFVCSAHPTYGK